MSYTLVLEWMPGDLYMSAVTARCTAPTSSYSVVWLPPNKVYQITLYCGSTSLVSFLVGAFRGKAWSYMTKESEVLLAQLYIIFRILLQKEMGAPNSTHIGRLNNWIDWYKEEKNNPWQNHKAPSREENMIILKCLAGELSASSGRMDDDFCKFIAHLNEAKYFHAKLHKNYHNFIKAFSNKLHYIKKWENKAEFSTDD